MKYWWFLGTIVMNSDKTRFNTFASVECMLDSCLLGWSCAYWNFFAILPGSKPQMTYIKIKSIEYPKFACQPTLFKC